MKFQRDPTTDMAYWFPLVKRTGVPIPKTVLVKTSINLIPLLDGEKPPGFDGFMVKIKGAIKKIGLPCFLRTGYLSGKHDWKETCFVNDLSKIGHHIYNLAEFSAIADLLGFPTNTWAVREMIPVKMWFHAFVGEMPVTREVRVFFRDKQIEHWQPYWPPDSIRQPDNPDWKSLIEECNTVTEEELATVFNLTHRLMTTFEGYWSCDWLQDINGNWIMIDMADGDRSFKWNPPKKKERRRCRLSFPAMKNLRPPTAPTLVWVGSIQTGTLPSQAGGRRLSAKRMAENALP